MVGGVCRLGEVVVVVVMRTASAGVAARSGKRLFQHTPCLILAERETDAPVPGGNLECVVPAIFRVQRLQATRVETRWNQ
jgi:hypothetical protein